MASFASSILSSKDHPSLVLGALQLVDLLLTKVPHLYKPTFRREGVFHEIEALADRQLASPKSKEKDTSEAPSPDAGSVPPPITPSSIPGYRKLASLSLEPEDAITLRARVIRFKYLTGDEESEGDSAFESLRRLVERISVTNVTEKELSEALRELADLFASPHTSVSSFELLQSGVVDALLQLATDQGRTRKFIYLCIGIVCILIIDSAADVRKRKELILEAFTARRTRGLSNGQTPFSTFVKKLQESLTRMENFDVITVAQSSDGELHDHSLCMALTYVDLLWR